MKNRKISIEDVARRAGVSISTVSRVVNHLPTVRPKIQAKVEEAIAYYKYQPNVSAQRLARGTNNAIGLVMPGYPGIFHSFYAIELIRGVGHACETLHLDMVFHITNGFNPINTNNVGGVIFADIIENRKQVETALEIGVPSIVINNVVNDLEISFVGVDNKLGGKMAGDYLSNLGHKRIAIITGNLKTQGGFDRFEGFKQSLRNNKIPLPENYVFEGDYSRRSSRIAAEKFFALPEQPSAIFACSDEMALEVVAVVNEHGLKVPQNVSIIGFDDNPASLYSAVALTTIHQPLFQMAGTSVKHLYSLISGKKKTPLKSILSPELVIRDSCSHPAKA